MTNLKKTAVYSFIAFFILSLILYLVSLHIQRVKVKIDKPEKWCSNPYQVFTKIHWPNYLTNECGHYKSTDCCKTLAEDPGGFTCYGISRKYNKNFYAHIKRLLKEKDEDYTLTNLSKEIHSKARLIVYSNYYMNIGVNKLYYTFRQPTFDFVVNSGQRWGVRKLQKSLKLTQDSHIGPNTVKATERVKDPKDYLKERAKFVRQTPAYRSYPKGMENRIKKNERQTAKSSEIYKKNCLK